MDRQLGTNTLYRCNRSQGGVARCAGGWAGAWQSGLLTASSLRVLALGRTHASQSRVHSWLTLGRVSARSHALLPAPAQAPAAQSRSCTSNEACRSPGPAQHTRHLVSGGAGSSRGAAQVLRSIARRSRPTATCRNGSHGRVAGGGLQTAERAALHHLRGGADECSLRLPRRLPADAAAAGPLGSPCGSGQAGGR